MTLSEIAESFQIPSGNLIISDFGGGHLHKTYRVKGDFKTDFILQNLNTFVFRKPHQLMDNAMRITEHLKEKMGNKNPDWEIIEFIPLKDNSYLFIDEENNYWRMFRYISNTPPNSVNIELVRKAGQAYGNFIRLLSDLPPPALFETIPNFHDLEYRIEQFRSTCREGMKERIIESDEQINVVENFREEMMILPRLLKMGKLTKRTTHNDTKIDNILFDKELNVRSVIDLDTVMPGLVHSDFGDAIRSFGNSAPEDEPEKSSIYLRMDVFEKFAQGFLESLKDDLLEEEKQTLIYAPSMFAYMQGIRFLNDYLMGDPYYKTRYEKHNLIRAKNQFTLLFSMKKEEDKMKRIIDRLI
ncbi:MAG: phosphotransferase enzyme family protein [Bacteroidales bacterium]